MGQSRTTPGTIRAALARQGGEARSPPPRPLSFAHPPLICPPDGDWQMQDLPGAPGTARQGRTRTIVSTNDGGKATQPRAPGHGRPPAAQRAAGHGRLSADSGAPGADVPLASTAGAPGQHCLSAALRAPGHERAPAAPRAVDYHWSCARHPTVPEHGRFPTAPCAAGHGRLSAASPAPGHDVPLAVTAGAPGHDRLSALSIATVPLPAGPRRLRQGVLPRVPANPRTLIYPQSPRINRHSRFPSRHSRESGNPRPPVATGGPQGGYAPATRATHSHAHSHLLSHHTTHQVHPAIQVPPDPRSCSTAATGFLRQRHSRAPPKPTRR